MSGEGGGQEGGQRLGLGEGDSEKVKIYGFI